MEKEHVKEKNVGGRPKIYSDEIVEKAQAYLDMCEDEEIEETKSGRGGNEYTTYRIKAKLPTKGGLARYLGVSRDTLYDWAKNYPTFSDIMEELGAEQEDRLINMGLSGDYNPTISKVLLTKHGYRDAQDVTSNGQTILAAQDREEADKAIDQLLNGGN